MVVRQFHYQTIPNRRTEEKYHRKEKYQRKTKNWNNNTKKNPRVQNRFLFQNKQTNKKKKKKKKRGKQLDYFIEQSNNKGQQYSS